jgi:hypothetical protein
MVLPGTSARRRLIGFLLHGHPFISIALARGDAMLTAFGSAYA